MAGNVVKSPFIRFDLHKRLLKQHKCFQFWMSFRVVVYSSAIHLVLGSLSNYNVNGNEYNGCALAF